VKQRPGGGKQLDYIPIETTLERLLTVAPDYSWQGQLESFVDGVAIVSGHLTIAGKSAFGIGAMKGPDADMSVKSANSEAMKNAAKNGFGVALELWDADHRDALAKARKLTTPAAMKQEVYRIAREQTGKDKPTMAEVAKLFHVNAGDLGDEATLRGILQDEGLL
jgi:hypothetical protein